MAKKKSKAEIQQAALRNLREARNTNQFSVMQRAYAEALAANITHVQAIRVLDNGGR